MLPGNLPKKIRDLLFGDPWGEVYPPQPPVPGQLVQVDGRTVALRILRDYICALTFYKPMGDNKPPRPFQLLEENFLLERPNAGMHEQKSPSISVEPSRGEYEAIGLGGYIQEETVNVYAPGTVVQWQVDYIETINLEIWASEEPELRSILAGIETAMNPVEQMSGLRFRMPDYFDQLVCFTLNGRENYAEPDAAKGRRRAQVEIEMWFTVVALVDIRSLDIGTTVDVGFDPQTGLPLDMSEPTTIPSTAPNYPPPQPPGTVYVYPGDAVDRPQLPRYPQGT